MILKDAEYKGGGRGIPLDYSILARGVAGH